MSNCSGSCSDGTCGTDGVRLPPGMLSHYNLNQSVADGTLVWIEILRTDGVPAVAEVSAEIISRVRSAVDGRIFGVVFGHNELKPLYDEIFSLGVDTLYHVKDERLRVFHPEAYCESLIDICERVVPAAVLMGSTPRGRELAPRIAASLDTGLVADCIALEADGRSLVMTSSYSRIAGGSIVCDAFPQMATVAEGAFGNAHREKGRKGTVIYRQYCGDSFKDIVSW